MSFSGLTLLLILILPLGCTHLSTGRTYLAEMEHDDSTFFRPSQDFPIVAGDSGRYWLTEEERRQRTPASEMEKEESLMSKTLRTELGELERMQPDEDLILYQEHEHKFVTVSEKIYFLKLPFHEREEYLMNRGFIEVPHRSETQGFERQEIVKNDVTLGMSKQDVLVSMGKPLKVEIAGNPRQENERWLYQYNGASKYIYFESGEVQGWE